MKSTSARLPRLDGSSWRYTRNTAYSTFLRPGGAVLAYVFFDRPGLFRRLVGARPGFVAAFFDAGRVRRIPNSASDTMHGAITVAERFFAAWGIA